MSAEATATRESSVHECHLEFHSNVREICDAARDEEDLQRLGFLSAHGIGCEQDYNKAAELWHKSAQQGNPLAQRNLGFMFLLYWFSPP